MQITFELTAAELRRAAHSEPRGSWFFRLMIAIGLLVLGFGMFLWSQGQRGLAIVIAGAVTIFLPWQLLSDHIEAHRNLRKFPDIKRPWTLVASDEAIELRNGERVAILSWGEVHGWSESRYQFNLFADFDDGISRRDDVAPIPKRAMTPEQQAEFRSLLARNACS